MINERDILGTQLIRRNDELSLLYEKIKIQQSTMNKGETQYSQRLEDIRILKLEIKKMRREKNMLSRSVANIEDLRYNRTVRYYYPHYTCHPLWCPPPPLQARAVPHPERTAEGKD